MERKRCHRVPFFHIILESMVDDMKEKMRSAMYSMQNKMQRFMTGRYGADALSKFLMTVVLVLLVLSMFIRFGFLYWIALALLIYSYFRIFSKNISKRYEENQKFVNFRYKMVVKWDCTKKHMAERKTHRFFKCPQCKQKVRVPKGRGKICITCPKCRTEFIKKS